MFAVGITAAFTKADSDVLPHVTARLARQLHKTALGAEETVAIQHFGTIEDALAEIQETHLTLALELSSSAIPLAKVHNSIDCSKDIALIVGHEVDGVSDIALSRSAHHIAIPMLGEKESLNVSVATAIALYELRRK